MECFSNMFKCLRGEPEESRYRCRASRQGRPCRRRALSQEYYCEEHSEQRRLNCSITALHDPNIRREALSMDVRPAKRDSIDYDRIRCIPQGNLPLGQELDVVCKTREPRIYRLIGELGLMTYLNDVEDWQRRSNYHLKIHNEPFNYSKEDVNIVNYSRGMRPQKSRLGRFNSVDHLPLE